MTNIHLINEKNSKLDLSSVKDANGEMVILQPKGAKGSRRECHKSVLEHPHVVSFIQVQWLSYESVSLTPIEVKPVQNPPSDTTLSTTVPTPESNLEESSDAVPPSTLEGSSDEVPPPPPEETVLLTETIVNGDALVTEEPVTAEARFVEATPATTSSEVVDVGEALSTSVVAGSRKKHRRD